MATLEPIYGNGFGSLCNVKISNENLSKLQENLVKSCLRHEGRSAKGNRQTDALA
jgi:histidine ammonia-lyase